jgi:hypothetical protein
MVYPKLGVVSYSWRMCEYDTSLFMEELLPTHSLLGNPILLLWCDPPFLCLVFSCYENARVSTQRMVNFEVFANCVTTLWQFTNFAAQPTGRVAKYTCNSGEILDQVTRRKFA